MFLRLTYVSQVLTFGAQTEEGDITVRGMNVTVQLPFPSF